MSFSTIRLLRLLPAEADPPLLLYQKAAPKMARVKVALIFKKPAGGHVSEVADRDANPLGFSRLQDYLDIHISRCGVIRIG